MCFCFFSLEGAIVSKDQTKCAKLVEEKNNQKFCWWFRVKHIDQLCTNFEKNATLSLWYNCLHWMMIQ